MELVYDDGAEKKTVFLISGRLASGQVLPRMEVSADSFASMGWVVAWGVQAVVDDFMLTGSQSDINRRHREADRLLRGQGNLSGRGRMRADGSLRPTYYPRGLILSTGEDVPRGASLRARLFILEMERDGIDLKRLTKRFPDVSLWREVRPLHLNEFVKHLEARKLARETIRLYLLQAKSTARYMALNYPDKSYVNVGATVKIPKPPPQKAPKVLVRRRTGCLSGVSRD